MTVMDDIETVPARRFPLASCLCGTRHAGDCPDECPLSLLIRAHRLLGAELDPGDPVAATALAGVDAAIHLVAAAVQRDLGCADDAAEELMLRESVDAARAAMLAARFALVHATDEHKCG